MAQVIEGIGSRIAKYRKEERISAQELAEAAGMSRSVIANIENGRRVDISVSELLAISEALRVPPVALIYDVTQPMAPTSASDENAGFQPRTIDVVDWVAGLDGPGQWTDARMSMEEDLMANGPAVLRPIGLSIEATYSSAGWRTIRLLEAARQLRTASEHLVEVTKAFFRDLDDGTFGIETTGGQRADLGLAIRSSDSQAEQSLRQIVQDAAQVGEREGLLAEKSAKQIRNALRDVKRLEGLLKSLGGKTGDRRDDDSSAPAAGMEMILSLWERMRFQYLQDLVEGDVDLDRYQTRYQFMQAIESGKLRLKNEGGGSIGEYSEEA